MLVFKKELYFKDFPHVKDNPPEWVKTCDGKPCNASHEHRMGRCGEFLVHIEWREEV